MIKNKKRKKSEIDDFLEKKKIKFEDCTNRQKNILLKENSKMWNIYTWNI